MCRGILLGSGLLLCAAAPQDPDLRAVSVTGPEVALPGQSIPVQIEVRSVGRPLGGEQRFSHELWLVGSVLGKVTHTLLSDFQPGNCGGSKLQVTIPAQQQPGPYRLRLNVAPVQGEVHTADNITDAAGLLRIVDPTSLPAPELRAKWIEPRSEVRRGFEATARFLIEGTGSPTVLGFEHRIYLTLAGKLDANAVLVAQGVGQPADLGVPLVVRYQVPAGLKTGAWHLAVLAQPAPGERNKKDNIAQSERPIGVDGDVRPAASRSSAFQIGESILGEVDGEDYVKIVRFSGTRGGSFRLKANRLRKGLGLRVSILTESDRRVLPYRELSSKRPSIQVELPEDATYILEIKRSFGSGDYRLDTYPRG